MSSLAQVSTAVQRLLTITAEDAATSSDCVQRVRRFTGVTWVQTLVLGCLATPGPSLTDLARMAAALGVTVTPQAIAQRCTPATATCLEQVLDAAVQHVIRADPVAIPLLERFTGVFVVDTSTIALPPALADRWPGCGNGSHHPAAALKLGVRLDLLQGTLTGPLLDHGRTHDRTCAITAVPLPPGALRLADLGFWSVADLAALSAADGFWLSRPQAQTAVLERDGDRLDLDALLATTTTDEWEREVCLGAAAQVPARLLAQRVPAAVARADWVLLVTNVPADRLTLAEAVVLARARWQIELLFKLWKQHGQIDQVRSANPWRLLAERSAKLIAMVLQHWTFLLGGWERVARSLPKAAATVRQNPRRHRPNLYQLLLACEEAA